MRSLMKGGASRFVDVVSQKIGFGQVKWIEQIGSSEYFGVLPRKQKGFLFHGLYIISIHPHIPHIFPIFNDLT